jgi:hypothetical protein
LAGPDRNSFWTTLPGILAASASLITALVGLLAFLTGRGPSPRASSPAPVVAAAQAPDARAPRSGAAEPPSAAPAPAPAAPATSAPQDDPAQDAVACQRIAGRWVWSTGGIVNIGTDGSLQWRPHATDPLPTVIGRWLCTDSAQRQYFFSWSHGFTDVFVLSEDGQRVSGTNQQTQARLFGNRQE